jgi:cell division GTPase FtsZ
MKKAGTAVMGSAQVDDGEDRAQKAAEMALDSPLLNYRNVKGAKKILLSIVSGVDSELQMDELSLIADYIQEQVGGDTEMIFGHSVDKQLANGIRVTLIATGFDDKKENSDPENIFYNQILKNKDKDKSEREEGNRENLEKDRKTAKKEVFDLNDNNMISDYYSTPAYKRCNVKLLTEKP